MLDLHHLRQMSASGAMGRLSRPACHVYLTMLGAATPAGECHLTVTEIADRIHGDWRTASGALSELTDAGLVAVVALSQRSRYYTIHGAQTVPSTVQTVPSTVQTVPTTEAPSQPDPALAHACIKEPLTLESLTLAVDSDSDLDSKVKVKDTPHTPPPGDAGSLHVSPKPRSRGRTSYPYDALDPQARQWFDGFWRLYPRPEDKQQAAKAFASALKASDDRAALIASMADGLKRYVRWAADTEKTYIKHPSTWINGRCWENEYDDQRRPNPNATLAGPTGADLDRMMAEARGER